MNDSGSPSDQRTPSDRNSDAGGSFQPADNRRKSAKSKRRRGFGYYFKWTVISLFCLSIITVSAVARNFAKRSKWLAGILNWQSATNVIKTGDLFYDYRVATRFPNQHTMNVLVLGCDVDYQEHVDHPVVIKGSPGRSDAIMIAHIDFDKNTVNMLSIPRDSAVPIPGMRGYHKVNAAHTFGGNRLSTQTISEDFGIPIDHTVSLNFDSFQKVVDAVDGVDLTIHKPLNYDDNWANLHVHLKPGFQHLNGYQAMGYVRIRHSDSDLARAERQHEFIEALRTKVTSFSNFNRLPDVVNAITDDMKSDLDEKEMLTLVHYATTLPKENIHLATLDGYEGRSYVYLYPDKAVEMIGKLFYDGNVDAVKLNISTRGASLAMRNKGRSTKPRKHRRTHTSDASSGHDGTSAAISGSPSLPDTDGSTGSDHRSGGENGSTGGDTPKPGAGDSGGKGAGDGDPKGASTDDGGARHNARRASDTMFS